MGDLNMPDLKRCPFCKGFAQPALENKLLLGGADKWYHIIRCKVCGAQTGLCETYELAVKCWNSRIIDCEECLFNAVPATDENMAKRGWVRERTCYHTVNDRGEACCSACGHSDEWWLFPADLNYCPNCGAKVVKE